MLFAYYFLARMEEGRMLILHPGYAEYSDNEVTLPVYAVQAGAISKTGWLRAAAIKSARGASAGTEKVRRRTNPRSGDARRGANTSLSTLPAVSGGNSTTVMGRWLRPLLSTPSPAVRRLRTQLELSWRWVETR